MLEFVNTKMGLQSFNHCVEYGAIAGQNFTNDRLTRIKLLVDRTSQINRQFCSNCQKPGHFVCNCFALRKCFNCNEKGQIAKNCNKTRSAPATIDSLEGLTKEHLVPEHRTLISVCASNEPVPFLYDTGSQYTNITRKTNENDLPPNKLSFPRLATQELALMGIRFILMA